MNKNLAVGIACLSLLLVGIGHSASAQEQAKSLSATMDVYVFPKEGQDASQQSKDEATCYEWAVGNVGADPF
ncbi:MAG: hypothetical protein WBM57_14740, partial [Woeseiaceae bacterium]